MLKFEAVKQKIEKYLHEHSEDIKKQMKKCFIDCIEDITEDFDFLPEDGIIDYKGWVSKEYIFSNIMRRTIPGEYNLVLDYIDDNRDKEFLKKNGFGQKVKYNQVANYTYLDRTINISIGQENPQEYFRKAFENCHNNELAYGSIRNEEELKKNLRVNCIPEDICEYSIDRYEEFLLYGVTGSGKTEIYLQLIEKALEKGKTAIMLVPEISLTPQTINRFIARFGKEKLAVLHSKLSIGERYDEWNKIKNGQANIIIGARSAIFAPTENVGIIIIDEEHDSSYKSETNPRYNAKEISYMIKKELLEKKGYDVESINNIMI